MLRQLTMTALAGLALAGCGDDATPSAAPAPTPSTTPAAAPAAPAAAADDPALIAEVRRQAKADSDICFLPDGVEQETTRIDLGGGATGVTVLCSTGMTTRWRRLYVRTPGAKPKLQSMLVYDLEGDSEWHGHTEIPELTWDAATRTFTGATALQATGCGWTGRWRWDGSRVALVEMKRVGCEREGQADKVWWPTTPPTPEPAVTPGTSGTE